MSVKNEVGNHYGRLCVVSRNGSIDGKAAWLCLCACGKEITVTGDSLRQGKQKSCGCFRSDNTAERFFKHGQSNGGGIKRESSTYKSWQEMWARCTRQSHSSYPNYGGKGIKVCPEWSDFTVFLTDMGDRPVNTSLDRINNEEDYGPFNCRWSTRKVQNRNRSIVRPLTLNGVTKCLAEWCELYGIDYHKAYYRVFTRNEPLGLVINKLTNQLSISNNRNDDERNMV